MCQVPLTGCKLPPPTGCQVSPTGVRCWETFSVVINRNGKCCHVELMDRQGQVLSSILQCTGWSSPAITSPKMSVVLSLEMPHTLTRMHHTHNNTHSRVCTIYMHHTHNTLARMHHTYNTHSHACTTYTHHTLACMHPPTHTCTHAH